MAGSMFAGTVAEEISLAAVTLQDKEPDGGTNIQIYNPANNKLTRYFWNEDPDGEVQEDGTIPGCWCDSHADPIPVDELPTLKAGQGFWMTSGQYNEDPAITVAGALYTTDAESPTIALEVALDTMDMHCHPMPYGELNLALMQLQDKEPDGGTNIQIYNPTNNKLTRYFWNEDPDGEVQEDGTIPGCWCDSHADPIPVDELPTLAAGQGFWMTSGQYNEDPAIIFPNPMYIEK